MAYGRGQAAWLRRERDVHFCTVHLCGGEFLLAADVAASAAIGGAAMRAGVRLAALAHSVARTLALVLVLARALLLRLPLKFAPTLALEGGIHERYGAATQPQVVRLVGAAAAGIVGRARVRARVRKA